MFKLPKHNDRGFSLIELAVVVAIIGILAAIAIPTFLGQREAAQDRQSHSALRNTVTAARAAAAATDDSAYPTDLVASLNAAEPSLTFDGTADSGDPDFISVNRVEDNSAIFASQAPNGKCWFVESNLQDDPDGTDYAAGTEYGLDSDGDVACNAGGSVGDYDPATASLADLVDGGSFGDDAMTEINAAP